MELGEKLKQARLHVGLSQRQLCGGEITRNMLSQIENGSAHPSMATLRYLAARLEKPLSYFLEENVVTSPNQEVMAAARAAWEQRKGTQVLRILEGYQADDPVFDAERRLLTVLATLDAAEKAVELGKNLQAAKLLEDLGQIDAGYCAEELERRRLLLLAGVQLKQRQQIYRALPNLDKELLIRAAGALDEGCADRSEHLLESAQDRESPEWNFLRGEVHLARRQFDRAAACYHRAEAAYPERIYSRLERCYRELGDYRQAYFYACKQR